MWYFIDSAQEKGVVYLNCSSGKMAKWFFTKSPSFTEVENIVFKAYTEDGMTSEILEKTDLLRNGRFGGIPIVSECFKDKMSKYLSRLIDFYPCQVTINEDNHMFFLCQLKNILPIIDYENSTYRELIDGSKILDDPIAIKSDVDERLLMVRDSKSPSIVVVSDLFKEVVEQEGLNIRFYRVDDSFW